MTTSNARSASGGLQPVPVIDVGEGGPLRHAELYRLRARELRDDCLRALPAVAAPLVPALDAAARRWLSRSCSPYVSEIDQIAATLGFSGIWLLNGSYQWGCTALAREEEGRHGSRARLIGHFRGSGGLPMSFAAKRPRGNISASPGRVTPAR